MKERVFDVAFEPKVYFSLTQEEVSALMECAKCHYDWKCRTTAIPGDGHFSLNLRQLDTLCKIVEMPPPRVNLHDVPDFLHSMLKHAKEITPDLKEGLTYGKEREEATS